MTPILLAVLVAAVVGIAVWVERRHRRLSDRLKRLELVERDVLNLRRAFTAERARAALAVAGREPRLPLRFPSQFGEDLLLWDLFDGRLDGFYIEVGAHDGVTDAVTYPFEAVGWTGLLVEPMPSRYEACKAARPGSHVVHAALAGRGSSGTTTLRILAPEGHEGDVSESGKDVLTAHIDGRAMEGRYGSHLRDDRGSVSVPLTTMDAVLEAMPGGPAEHSIDYAIIDVEGFELDLLEGFDLEKWKPRVLLIEDLSMGLGAEGKKIRAYVERFNYRHVGWFAYNRLFVRNDEVELLKKAYELFDRPAFPRLGKN